MLETSSAISVMTNNLADFLATASVGETISFADMSRELGCDVLTRRYVIQKARDQLLAGRGIRFDSVFRVGLKRVSIDELVGVTDRAIKKIRRDAKRANKRIDLQLSRANDVDERTRFDLNNRRSLLGAIEVLSSRKSVEQISKVADERVIPFGKVFDALR